jgi:Flp pilus assembly protein TadG
VSGRGSNFRGPRSGSLCADDDRGSAVAEFAVALPAVLLVLATVLGGVQLGALQLRLQDASADAARSLGRGDSASFLASRIARQAPGARSSVTRSDGLVCVHLVASPAPPAGLLGLAVSATSCGLDESSAVL